MIAFASRRPAKIREKQIKTPIQLLENGKLDFLRGGLNGENRDWYKLSYSKASALFSSYSGPAELRVSLYLDDARYNDLYIFVIDADCIPVDADGFRVNKSKTYSFVETDFYKQCAEQCDFKTQSKSGGWHYFFGIHKDDRFDKLNLLSGGKSYISKTIDDDEYHKFDIFCDGPRLIYEYFPWENKPLTDKTEIVLELLSRFDIKRTTETGDISGKGIFLEDLTKDTIISLLKDWQKPLFEKVLSADANCSRSEWFSMGCSINTVFGEELGGSIWLLWSRTGESYQPQSCINTWVAICSKPREDRNLETGEGFTVRYREKVAPIKQIKKKSKLDLPEIPEEIKRIREQKLKEEEQWIKGFYVEVSNDLGIYQELARNS